MKRIFLLFTLFPIILFGQQKCNIFSYDIENHEYIYETNTNNYKKYLDSLSLNSYPTLHIDSMIQNLNICKLYINKGNFYSSQNFIKKIESYQTINLNKIKDSLILQGMPFSKIELDPKNLENDKKVFDIKIDRDSIRHIDDIKFIGYRKISKNYKKHLLKDNQLSEQNISNIQNEIKSNPYIKLTQDSNISYQSDSTILYVYTKKEKRSFFDGIIGFGTNTLGKILLNGNINVQLGNVFNRMEEIELNWLADESQSQNLRFNIVFPYLFLKDFGLQSQLNIRKQDSTFVKINWVNGLSYQIRSNQFLTFNAILESSNFINSNQTENYDYQKHGFGLAYQYKNFNLNFFQENKSFYQFSSNYLKRNDEAYSSGTNQIEFSYKVQRQQKIHQNHYGYSSIQGENLLEKNNQLFPNEFYWIGGINNIRGFNQNSIPTTSFNLITLGYRFIPNNDFLIELFTDLAYIKHKNYRDYNSMFAIGTGIQYRSKMGLLKLMYAMGKQENNPFDFNQAKIHFGISTIF